MNPEKDNFESLRRLLKLKRYEQPPPRYFNEFSGQVLARIKWDAEQGRSTREDYSTAAPWLHRVWNFFQGRPLVPGAVGAGICALLVAGVAYNEKRGNIVGTMAAETPQAASPTEQLYGLGQPVALMAPGNSTNPVIPLKGSLFAFPQINPINPMPASQFGRPPFSTGN